MSRPRRACARSRPFRLAASQMISPREGSLRPAISRSAVDLPQPDGPSTETNSPGRTARSRPSRASVPLANRFATPRRATTDGPLADRNDDGECDGNLASFDWPQPAAGTIPLFAPLESGGGRDLPAHRVAVAFALAGRYLLVDDAADHHGSRPGAFRWAKARVPACPATQGARSMMPLCWSGASAYGSTAWRRPTWRNTASARAGFA